MKISLDWLSEYVAWKETDPQIIAEALTRAVGEVDHMEVQGEFLRNVVVGKVKNLRKHPNSDKLSLCDVESGRGDTKVVCGATNLKEGMLVALARVGATVKWHGGDMMTLAPVKIRGERSEGMICAAEELDLAALFPPPSHGGSNPIIELPGNLNIGTPLREALGLGDVIVHIDNHAITHRPDLFSHVGIARECVALGLAAWKPARKPAALKFPKTKLPFTLRVEDPALISRYCACVIEIDDPGETPLWMKNRLLAIGIRSINLPVDITNYVMMEIGAPMHGFDMDDIVGDVLIRRAKAGETMTALDASELRLPAGAMVMSDARGIFDLFGIMGGLRSATKSATRRIYLHAASVDPVSIRQTVLATGHRTDAATIYEKTVPPIAAEKGFCRACELFMLLVPGARIVSTRKNIGKSTNPKPIAVRPARVATFLGESIKAADIRRILTDLGCTVKPQGKGILMVTPPFWRIKDLKEEPDIFEEIARIRGYNDIPPVMPKAEISTPKYDDRVHRLRDAIKEEGFFEFLHLAFVSPDLLRDTGIGDENVVRVKNPLGEELSLMRPTLVPSLLATTAREARGIQRTLRGYEIGNAITDAGEYLELCMIIASKSVQMVEEEPLLQLKQSLADALRAVGYDVTVQNAATVESWMHPGRSAELISNGNVIGMLTEVHPRTAQRMNLPARTAVVRINLDELFAAAQKPMIATPLAAFPAIEYDETFPLTNKRTAAQLLASAVGAHPLLTHVKSVGLYRDHDGIRVTLRFTYRSPERTLREEEVVPAHRDVVASLARS